MNSPLLGMMQGRLVDAPDNRDLDWFPVDNWVDEFKIAKQLGLDTIELVIDRAQNNKNPLQSLDGRKNLCMAFLDNGLKPYSCCLNFIIDNSIEDKTPFELCAGYIVGLGELGVRFAILPLFGKSCIKKPQTILNIEKLNLIAFKYGVQILIETNESAATVSPG